MGDGTSTTRTSPIQIGTGTNWFSVAAGGEHSIAIKMDTTLWAWGNNGAGQLGNGTFNSTNSPIQIGITTGWFVIGTGNSFSMAVKADGTLWSWGYNFYGQVGNGTTNNQTSPVQIGTETDWYITFDGGFSHSVALKSNGSLRVWGANNSAGLLGNSSNNQVNSPIAINCPTTLSTVDFSEHGVAIYPNPVSETLFIANESTESIESIAIHDLMGKKIEVQIEDLTRCDFSQLQNGIYLITIKIGDKVVQKKCIKN